MNWARLIFSAERRKGDVEIEGRLSSDWSLRRMDRRRELEVDVVGWRGARRWSRAGRWAGIRSNGTSQLIAVRRGGDDCEVVLW